MKNDKSESDISYVPLFLVALLVLLVCGGVTLVIWQYAEKVTTAADGVAIAVRGQLGDMFGAANAVFSGLAFGILIFTMHLQRKDLELQRKQLKQNTDELRNQAAELLN